MNNNGVLDFQKKATKKLVDYLRSNINLSSMISIGIFEGDEKLLMVISDALQELSLSTSIIETEASLNEIKKTVDKSNLNLLVSSSKYISTLNWLQWECDSLDAYLCIDCDNAHTLDETRKNKLMNKKLWEFVGNSSNDSISAGGWISSYTRELFSVEEMTEYSQNVSHKLKEYLTKDSKVLEIGCASGFTMFRIAPDVGIYFGTDMSSSVINKNNQKVDEQKIENIFLSCLPAHEINTINEVEFDVIIINSVVHCFTGLNYLRNVLIKSIDLLKDKGIVFIGDVMDLDLKNKLIESLQSFKLNNISYNTKTDFSEELFVSRRFFNDLKIENPCIKEIIFSNKIHTLENELTKFRYDVIFKIDKQLDRFSLDRKCKYQYAINIYGRE